MTPDVHYARGPEGHVAYQVTGGGPVDIVFVPDWVTNVEVMWEEPAIARFFTRLGSIGRLISFDKRGSGISDPVPLGALPTLEQWMDDIRTVLDAAGAGRAVVFAHGDGAPMAMLFAASYPERTVALVVADGTARKLRAPDYPHGIPLDVAPRHLEAMIAEWGTGHAVRIGAPSMASEAARRGRARLERLAMSPSAFAGEYQVALNADVRAILGTIRVPTLVLHRAGNRYIRVGNGRYLAEHIPRARFVELPGDDHLFYAGDVEAMLAPIEEFVTGARQPVVDDDRVLATVLFTDIVGSTEHATRLGDRAWRDLLERHDTAVRQELGRFRGREIHTTGDGFFATFDGPARAVRCALAIRAAVRPLGLEVRSGLHTGECELRGDDVSGIAVHIGARVAAAAKAGEVLVSGTLKDLVTGSGLRFVERGAHRLKGIEGEWPLHAAA
jgi:class 3 adenylate cyclase